MNEKENNDVRIFTESMERELLMNEFKDGWIGCNTSYLVEQFRKKVHTVNQICDMSIVQSLDEYSDVPTTILHLQKLLADLANYAMMISGNVGRTLK